MAEEKVDGVAIIIGGGPGTSASCARLFADRGLEVAVAARNPDKSALVALEASHGVRRYGCDAADPEAVAGLFDSVSADLGSPTLVVHNIDGRMPDIFRKGIAEADPELVRQVIMNSAFSAFLVGQQAARRMLENPVGPNGAKGTIIYTNASAAMKGYPKSGAFAIASHGKSGLAQSMARELMPQGIHVAHVPIDAAIGWTQEDGSRKHWAAGTTVDDNMADPDRIAEVYWALFQQHRSTWAFEVVLRPWTENWSLHCGRVRANRLAHWDRLPLHLGDHEPDEGMIMRCARGLKRLVPLAGLLAWAFAGPVGADTRIAFGSCADDDKPNHPIWDALAAAKPDAMLLLGDNVYGDTRDFIASGDADLLRAEYAKLAASPGYQRLKGETRVFATWDDHDYGLNDGGAEFAHKAVAESVFLDFFDVPADAPERSREGIYSSRRFVDDGKEILVLMLDARYFRSAQRRSLGSCPYRIPSDDPEATVLGARQWAWLADELERSADLVVIGSGIQAIANDHCWERWGPFPSEREKLFATIRASGAKNVMLVSGDRHLGEISRLAADDPLGVGYPLYEVTSSPLSARSGFGEGEPNRHRVGGDNVRVSNFGLIAVDWADRTATLSLVDQNGDAMVYQVVELR